MDLFTGCNSLHFFSSIRSEFFFIFGDHDVFPLVLSHNGDYCTIFFNKIFVSNLNWYVSANEKTIFDLKEKKIDGFPDGMTIDVDGNLWVAVFGKAQVRITKFKKFTINKYFNIKQNI